MSWQDKLSRRGWWIVLALCAALLLGAAVWWAVGQFSDSGHTRKRHVVQEIALLKPPPPPPPPKTPPPPPKEVQQKLDVPKPDQAAAKPASAPPPGPDLGVDAKGTGSGDGFGLVGKPGGGDLIGSKGGGDRFAWYGALVKDRIQDAVSKDKKLRNVDFKVVVNVWVDAVGLVTRAELVDSTKVAELDEALRSALRNLPALREAAPSDMPQPIKLRITAR